MNIDIDIYINIYCLIVLLAITIIKCFYQLVNDDVSRYDDNEGANRG